MNDTYSHEFNEMWERRQIERGGQASISRDWAEEEEMENVADVK